VETLIIIPKIGVLLKTNIGLNKSKKRI